MRALLAVLLCLWTVPAAAAPDCEALDQDAFRTLYLDAVAAIDRGDAGLHTAIVDEVRSRLPCLTFAPPPRLWADFLVGVAVVEFAKGGDWQTPMEAALRIRPNVDRIVSGAHPLNRWEPPVRGLAPGAPVPEGVRLWVDGTLAETLPPAEGLYLVQKEEDGWFETRLVEDEAVALGWVTAPVERPRRMETWLYPSGGLGVGAINQSIDYLNVADGAQVPAFSDYLAEDLWGGVMPQGAVEALFLYGRIGAHGRAEFNWANTTRGTGSTGYVGPAVTLGQTVWTAGVGIQGFEVFEGGCRIWLRADHEDADDPEEGPFATWDDCYTVASPRVVPLPYGYGGVWFRADRPWRPQPRVLMGYGPSMARFDFSMAMQPKPTPKGAQWRYNSSLTVASATFERRDADYRVEVYPLQVRLGASVGLVFGRVR